MYFSIPLISAFAALAYGQGAPISAVPQTVTGAPVVNGCGGCYVVAGVAQVIFADYTSTQTITAVASQGVGRNGSTGIVTVSTIYSQALQPFSFGTEGVLSGNAVGGSYIPISGSLVTIGQQTLTSPTAYNVFTGYTEYTVTANGGACSTGIALTSQLPVAAQYPFTAGDFQAQLMANEADFASKAGLRCAISAVAVSTVVPVQTTTTVVTSSTTGVFRPSPIAAQTSTPVAATTSGSGITLSAQSSSAMVGTTASSAGSPAGSSAGSSAGSPAGSSAGSSSSGAASSTPTYPSISQGAASGFRAHYTSTTALSASVLAVLFALPALGAFYL